MLRCNRCGGRAIATLKHLHCLDEDLCMTCAKRVVEEREGRRPSRRVKREAGDFGDYTYPQPVTQAA